MDRRRRCWVTIAVSLPAGAANTWVGASGVVLSTSLALPSLVEAAVAVAEEEFSTIVSSKVKTHLFRTLEDGGSEYACIGFASSWKTADKGRIPIPVS